MQHLREGFMSQSNREYVLLDEEKSKKFKESFDNHKNRLNENSNDTIRILKALKEDARSDEVLKAAVDSILQKLQTPQEETPKFKVWKFPIGRYDVKNANGRIYPKALYQNVKDRQRDTWMGIPGLMDHPREDSDPGSARDQAIVWLDMDVANDGLVYGYGSFVGPYGSLAQDIIEKGGRIGFSTSGFGDVDSRTHIVDPESYCIERISDIVLNPSQNVYGSYSDPHLETADPILAQPHQVIDYTKKEMASVDLTGRAEGLTESAKPIQSKIIKEKEKNMASVDVAKVEESKIVEDTSEEVIEDQPEVMEESKKVISPEEEKRFRKYVEMYMDKIGTVENPLNRLKEVAEILNQFEDGLCPDLRETVETRLVEDQKALESLLESALSTEKELGTDLVTIKEATPKLYEKAVFLQDQATDFKELSEALTERNIELAAEVKSLTEQLKETKKGADEEKIIAKLTEEKEKAERKLQATLRKTGKVNEALELRIKSLRKRLDEAVVTIDETSTKGEKVTKLVREKKSIESQLKQALKEEELNNKRIEEENKKLAETVQAVKEGRREALTDLEVLKIELTETKMKANKLARKNSILESKSALQEERAKKAEIRKNADIVALKEKIDEITKKAVDRTSITEAKREIIKMKKDTEKLNETNRVFEKQNGVLETQLKQAAELLVESKKIREAEKAKIVELAETNIQLKAANEKLLQETEALKEALAKTAEAFDNLAAEHTSYKEAVTNKINPIKNFQPKFETRVGQHLNFREGLGAGIEAYWGDLVAKYGENVTPYERHIRGAKTLQEATSAFLKFKDYIDPKFAQVHNSILDESAIHTKAQRAALLEAAGQPVYQEEISVEERNKIYLEKMRKQGFKF